MVSVTNLRTGRTLANFARVARTVDERKTGLLNSAPLQPGEGMFFTFPCSALHTVGMQFGIDIVFLDIWGSVLELLEDVGPGKQAICPGAYSALELPPGTIAQSGTLPGDALTFEYF